MVADGLVTEAPLELPEHMTLQLAFHLLDSVHAQIRVADEKIRALFGSTALLAAALAFGGQMPPSLTSLGTLSPAGLALAVARAALMVAIAFSVGSAVLALLPRVAIAGRPRSLFFFGDVAQAEHGAFVRSFAALSEQEALLQILSQVHVNSKIVTVKYAWTWRAAAGFLAAIVLWMLMQLIALLA